MKLLAHKQFTAIATNPEALEKHREQNSYREWVKNYKPVDPQKVLELVKQAKGKV